MHNQQNQPLPKKKRVDSKGNSFKRVFAKSGNATLMICSGVTENAASVFCNQVSDLISKLGGKSKCSFFIAR